MTRALTILSTRGHFAVIHGSKVWVDQRKNRSRYYRICINKEVLWFNIDRYTRHIPKKLSQLLEMEYQLWKA